MGIHQLPDSFRLLARDVRVIVQQVSNPLLVNLIRPMRLKKIGPGKVHEQASHLCRVEHTRIKDDDERCHLTGSS